MALPGSAGRMVNLTMRFFVVCMWRFGLGTMNGERDHRQFQATKRRIYYLHQELYNYDRFLRNPQGSDNDMAHSAKWAIDASDHEAELRELEYLLELAQRERRPVPPWLLVLLMVLTGLSMLTAVWAIWLQVT